MGYNVGRKKSEKGEFCFMKKLLSLLLAGALFFSLAACQTSAPAEDQSSVASDPFLSAYSSDPVPKSTASSSSTASSAAPQSTADALPSQEPVSSEETPKTVRITFPEGYTFTRMAEKLEENGVCTVQELMDVVNSYDYSKYPLVAAIPENENRCFRLEGYLFPDTYDFYIDSDPEDVLGKMIRNTENRITDAYRARAAELGYTMDEILTIASLIQGEAGNPQEMGKVSSIVHNRLKAGRKLEVDASINYVEKWIKPFISGDINRYNSYYNTYKCAALPSGPICNPGIDWIEAALYPEDTDYLYFVNDANGNYYYASTHEEHLENCEKAGVPVK